MTYRIMRMFFDDDKPTRTIQTGLTLEEAQEYCQDPETSSSTCANPDPKDGRWFDGYDEEVEKSDELQ